MQKSSLFGKLQVEPGNNRLIEMEKLRIRIERGSEGWIFQQAFGESTDKEHLNEFSEKVYFHTGKSNTLILSPSLPSKSMVFKGNGLFVSPGQKLLFYLKIPLSIQIYYSKIRPEKLLKELLGTPLSNTWFGNPESGEPAFSLGNEYFLNPEDAQPGEFEALCPVSVFNNSQSVLEIERLIIRVENLTLYKKEEKILTSVVSLEYKGKDVLSSANYHHSKSIHGEKPEVVAKSQADSGKNLLKINFHFIKNIYRTEP